jgi:hypothetical protein
MQSPQNLESFLALEVVGLSLQPLIYCHAFFLIKTGIFTIDCLMQQGRERDDIVGVLQALRRDFNFVRAALRDDVMILIAAARTAKSLDGAVPAGGFARRSRAAWVSASRHDDRDGRCIPGLGQAKAGNARADHVPGSLA